MEREDLYKEIDLIQGCISRMANCSFIIKGLALTVFSAVLAITQETVFADPLLLVCTVMIPFCCFWILDAIFLKTEKEYRLMYKWVIRERKLNNEEYLFDLRICLNLCKKSFYDDAYEGKLHHSLCRVCFELIVNGQSSIVFEP